MITKKNGEVTLPADMLPSMIPFIERKGLSGRCQRPVFKPCDGIEVDKDRGFRILLLTDPFGRIDPTFKFTADAAG